jgi:hypothetical protein
MGVGYERSGADGGNPREESCETAAIDVGGEHVHIDGGHLDKETMRKNVHGACGRGDIQKCKQW